MHAARLRPLAAAVVLLAGATLTSGDARADAPNSARGLVVVAEGETAAAAASLAHAVYGDPGLLPPGLDEAHARVLVGGPVAPDAPRDLRDLAETRAALHGDDAPSRSVLVGLGASLHVKGLLVVEGHPGDKPLARVFVVGTGSFDAVLYESDPPPVVTWGAAASTVTWSSALLALHRGFADATTPASAVTGPTAAPAAALGPLPPPIEGEKSSGGSKPFYTSPWFWGAIGAAAFAGAAFYFATRDSSDPNIQLQVQVPSR